MLIGTPDQSKENQSKPFFRPLQDAYDAANGIVTGVAKPIFTPVLEGANNIADSILPMAGGDNSRNKPPVPLQEADGRPHSIIERPGVDGKYTSYNDNGTWPMWGLMEPSSLTKGDFVRQDRTRCLEQSRNDEE
ncbi:hypothetical protein [Cupriavidus basilensis]|uniref:hypothetical protein n=1 Tax=Cupriavidus basilensis TaxID=68895 RepID=UPI00192AB82B|nr:hypothetical protein [Cupriavidus basilensis]